jgi:hypothetical protein
MGTLKYWPCMSCIIWVVIIRDCKKYTRTPAVGINCGLQPSSPCSSRSCNPPRVHHIQILALRPTPPAKMIEDAVQGQSSSLCRLWRWLIYCSSNAADELELQTELLGAHKRMYYTSCKDDLTGYSLCKLILFGWKKKEPCWGRRSQQKPTGVQKYKDCSIVENSVLLSRLERQMLSIEQIGLPSGANEFCRLYLSSHHGSVGLLSDIFTNTVSPVRSCLSIWVERFCWNQKEDELGLSINSSVVFPIFFGPIFSHRPGMSDLVYYSILQFGWQIRWCEYLLAVIFFLKDKKTSMTQGECRTPY